MAELITTPPKSPLAVVEASTSAIDALSSLVTTTGFRQAEIKRPLTDQERAMIEATGQAASAALVPASPDQAAASINRMLIAFPAGGSTEQAALVVQTYLATVARLPAWAISKAALAFAQGAVEGQSTKFKPSSAEFVREVNRILEPVRMAKHKAGLLLLAKPVRNGPRNVPFDWRQRLGLQAVDSQTADSA